MHAARLRFVLVVSIVVVAGAIGVARPASAQDNYEIQVYGADTVPPGATMVEIHSNVTARGRAEEENGLLPTNHAWHETLEITHGFNDWFEVGFYTFTSARADQGWDWVGNHVRPRVRVPESWHWPVGVSISQEFGYQRRQFSEDTWTYELRPIVDQKIGRWYWSFNPAFERSVKGVNVSKGFEWSPNAAITYDVSRRISAGVEYYGAFGPITGFDIPAEQEHQIFPAVNIDFGPKWEFNVGVGAGLTAATDRLLVKTILGYRFSR